MMERPKVIYIKNSNSVVIDGKHKGGQDVARLLNKYIDHIESELEKVKVELADKEDKLNKCMQLLASTDTEIKRIVRKMLTPGMGSIQEDATKVVLLKEFEKLVK